MVCMRMNRFASLISTGVGSGCFGGMGPGGSGGLGRGGVGGVVKRLALIDVVGGGGIAAVIANPVATTVRTTRKSATRFMVSLSNHSWLRDQDGMMKPGALSGGFRVSEDLVRRQCLAGSGQQDRETEGLAPGKPDTAKHYTEQEMPVCVPRLIEV